MKLNINEIRARCEARRSYCELAHVERDTQPYEDRADLLAEVERLTARLEWIVGAADCYNGPVVKLAKDALEGKEIPK